MAAPAAMAAPMAMAVVAVTGVQFSPLPLRVLRDLGGPAAPAGMAAPLAMAAVAVTAEMSPSPARATL